MMAEPLFLDDDALRKLTGFAHKGKQVAQLRKMGIPFWVNGRGQAVVASSAVVQWQAKKDAHRGAVEAEASRLIAAHERFAAHEAAKRERAAQRQTERAQRRAETRPALVRHHTAKRRAAKLRRTPPWADMAAIEAFYAEARRLTVETGVPHHVDHDIPLQSELVSGLHVHNNLQILTGSQNSRKKNRFEVCDG